MTSITCRSLRNRRARFTAAIETLEARRLLTSVVVNTTADSTDVPGSTVVSLRDAINVANQSTTATTISFNATVFATAKTIILGGKDLDLRGAKPVTITGPAAGVTVDGYQESNDFHIDLGATLSLSDMTLTGGNSDEIGGNGGGIENDGSISLSHVIITDNAAADTFGPGGGIDNNGTATLIDCTVSDNTTDFYGSGGGINNTGSMILTDCTISGNASGPSNAGGGINSSGPITLTGCTISGNTGGTNGGGGGIQLGSVATLINCTISDNSDPGPGGGINFAAPPGTVVTVADCTITDNTAGGGGGIVNYFLSNPKGGANYLGGELDITNTIIAGNTATVDADTSGAFNSSGHNLIGDVGTSTGWTTTDLTGTNAKPLNADLGPLSDNGGPTLTMLPLNGSPAIGNGSKALVPSGVSTDQRGLARVVNGKVDIGAVESQTPAIGNVSGVVFGDSNGDGIRQGTEQGLAGWIVYADMNNNGKFDAGEPFATSDSTGQYAIGGLPAGIYTVGIVAQTSYQQTAPSTAAKTIVAAGQVVAGPSFGEALISPPNVYSATAGFSTANNPNGPWAYGYSTSETSSVILYTSETQSQGINAWTLPPLSVPAVVKNTTSATVFADGALAPGQLFFDPGFDAEYSHIRFTVPVAGNYSIAASFFGASVSGTTTDVHILYNGKSLFDGVVNGYLRSSAISKSLTIANVAKGAIIDAIVGEGPNGASGSDQTGITETITRTAPATISGMVFSDANASGKQDSGETGLAGVKVYIDTGNAGYFVPGDPAVLTSAHGAFSFTGLAPGTYVVRDETLAGYILTAPTVGDLTITVASGQVASGYAFAEAPIGPFGGTPAAFGRIQAENFDIGGQNAGYFNPGNVNRGGLYRPAEGVGIGAIPAADAGGFFVGWTLPGEYLNYTASVANSGVYTLNFRVACQGKGGTFHLNVDGRNVTGELSVPSTGDWNTYTIVSKTGVNLVAGTHVLQLVIDSDVASIGAAGNFDWFEAFQAPPANVLVNGNFSKGTAGFTSQYPNYAQAGGGYIVASNPTDFGEQGWLSFGDHTSGTGLMLIVDGSVISNTTLWQETVNVAAGSTYSFAGWAANVHDDNSPPRLAIYVNGVQIGTPYNVGTNPGGIWNPFGATWSSGSSKTATIKIVDLNTDIGGNDFALDDFSFGG